MQPKESHERPGQMEDRAPVLDEPPTIEEIRRQLGAALIDAERESRQERDE